MAHSPSTAGSKHEIRAYYRTVGRFIELELAGRDDAAYWRERAHALGRPRVLELGAGTGRVTRVVAPLAHRLVAVDLSREMLDRARMRLEGFPHVHLILGDMREIRLRGAFDLVIAANDPFVHLPGDRERDRALACAAEHLAPGGLFVLDALWLRPQVRERAREPGGWRRTRSLGSDGRLSVRERWALEPDGLRGSVEFEYREADEVVGRASFRPRLWSPEELRERLPRVGLRVRRLLGGYDGRPWDPADASSLIVEAERADAASAAPPAPAPPQPPSA